MYDDLTVQANTMYPQAYLAQLFKNQTKLVAIVTAIAASKAGAEASPATSAEEAFGSAFAPFGVRRKNTALQNGTHETIIG